MPAPLDDCEPALSNRMVVPHLRHPEDCESASSIVEHMDLQDEGESPQWKYMTRSPSAYHDEATQTDDLDATFQQKLRALEELEEDIEVAQQSRAGVLQQSSELEARDLASSALQRVSELQYELHSQRCVIQEMSVQMRYLTQLVEQLMLASSSGAS